MTDIRQRLEGGPPLLLDGATGTELQRRGISTTLPLWSAAALMSHPEQVTAIHEAYRQAGAEVITANTFRTHGRNLAAAGREQEAERWTRKAVELARRAAGDAAWVAGSQSPLEDCYQPQHVPDGSALRREHARMAAALADAGVDLILVETQNNVGEAAAATEAASQTGLPVAVSFICTREGDLLSGESLEDAVAAVRPFRPQALLINCSPAPSVAALLGMLQEVAERLPVGAYANVGEPDAVQGWRNTDAVDPSAYARYATDWLRRGARLVGGCCGTTPEHIRQLALLLKGDGRR